MSVKEQNNSNDNIKEHPKPWNLLADHHAIKIDQKLIFKLTKEAANVTIGDVKRCKVLHLTSEWNFEELPALFNGFNLQEYSNFFVIIIDGKYFDLHADWQTEEPPKKKTKTQCKNVEKILNSLNGFHHLILQLTSKDENMSKVYYKEVNSGQFLNISQQEENVAEIKDFSSLLRSVLDSKIENVEQITAAWQNIIKSSISMKFLKLFENLFFKLILEVTKSGTKADLLTVLDAPAEHEGRFLSFEAQNYLFKVFDEEPPSNVPAEVNDSNKDDSEAENESQTSSSVLFTAIEHKKAEIIDYLITYWTNSIQKLPVDHQVKISTIACQTDQHDILCDLLDIADFPLPEDYEDLDDSDNQKLKEIVKGRRKLKQAIKKENFKEIDDFIDNNPELKLAFISDEKSAMDYAFTLKKFKVFFYLKSVGYETIEPINIADVLSKEEAEQTESKAKQQKRRNVKEAVYDPNNPVMLLSTKSGIHNKRTSKDKATEYRKIIHKWYEDISKIELCLPVLELAASCDNLKIIFDFESETVERIDMSSNALGLAYGTLSSNVFIGARLSNEKQQQELRGILAHELCHYVMSMVYDNRFRPYYEDAKVIKDKFSEIVKAIDKWSTEDSECPDDECNGIISSVFTEYPKRCFHLELIVRVVHILAAFMDDPVKSANLQEKYKILYDFWKDYVVPELRKYLKKDQNIIHLNGVIGLLYNIQSMNIQVRATKVGQIMDQKITVIITNIPKILLIDIYNYLQNIHESLMDSRNIFIDTEKLNNIEIWKGFKRVCFKNLELNIIVDCTNRVPASLDSIFINKELHFVFIVSNDSQSEEIIAIVDKMMTKDAKKMEINYNWNDLTEESQKSLLETEINFQNSSEIALKELFVARAHPGSESLDAESDLLPDLSEVIDDELLNMIIDSKMVTINSVKEPDQNEKYSQFINVERLLIKKIRQKDEEVQSDNLSAYDSDSDSDNHSYSEINRDSDNTDTSSQKSIQAGCFRGKKCFRWRNFLNLRGIFHKTVSISNSLNSTDFVPDKKSVDGVSVRQEEINRMRDNKIKYVMKKSEIDQENLLLEAKNQKFVLISDKAGNGKSWAMKNFTKILHQQSPTSWVTYVDLKQFIKEFKAQMAQQVMPEFSTYIAENILRTEHKFESKIFQKLYKDGKIFILFDGFDEIAPNCAEFVSNLAESFQSNGRNQLWIATRDYFEVDLMEKLEIDVAYGLEEMDDDDGIELIVRSWMLMDLGDKKKAMTVEEFNQHVKRSPNWYKYKVKAEKIVKKVKTGWNRSVGMPQMYKMIADAYKDEENIKELKESKIFEKYIKTLYRRWSREKGEIREEASIECQNQRIKFWEFHLYQAILSLYPALVEILFPKYDGKNWSVEEVIACGILSIINGKYYFIHETLREYFAADALAKALESEEINDKIIEVFVNVLTFEQYKIVRMFLNDFIDSTILIKIRPKIKNYIEKFNKMESFAAVFTENLENFIDFVLSILKDYDYKHVKDILEGNSYNIVKNTKNSKIFFKFQDFLCQFLTANDLKNLIEGKEIFQAIIRGELKIEVFVDFVMKIEGKTGHEFVQKELRKAINEGWMHKDGFEFFFDVTNLEAFKFQEFMKMMQKFLSPTEVLEFLKKEDDQSYENILLSCVENGSKEILRILWTEIENYFAHENMSKEFKELAMQQDKIQQKILHKIAESEDLEHHKIFWELLLNTFKDQREELKDFMLKKKYGWGYNFVHDLVDSNKDQEIIEWTFKILKENFNDFQFQEFIQSNGGDNRNFILNTAIGGHNIETFKFLWELFRSSFKSEQEFWKVLKEVDDDGLNIFNYAAEKSPFEVFNFLIDEFDEKCSKEEIKKMLSNSDKRNRSLLHLAAENRFTDTLKAVWNNLKKYLKSEEILEIAKQVESRGSENFLFCVKSSETFEFAIEELEKIASHKEIRSLLCCINKKNQNILQFAAYWRKSLKLYETLWKIFRKYFENSEIKNFIQNVDEDGNNLLHLAVSGLIAEKEVVELIWNEIKTFLDRDEQIEYLKMKGKYDKNLIGLSRGYEIMQWMKNVIEEYGIKFLK